MKFLPHNNLSHFLAFVPTIKKEIAEWRLINISLTGESPGSIFYIAKKLGDVLQHKEGEIFVCNNRELLGLARTGRDANIVALQATILQGFPEYKCSIEVVEAAGDGLQKLELRFREERGAPASGSAVLADERQQRKKNIIMIADDDMFMRSLAKKALEAHGDVTLLEDATAVVDTYLKIIPDILFLDIHMPGGSGIDILNEILSFDPEAHVVMLSADSAKDNVLGTRKIGAKGFIAKPFTKERLEEALWKCPTARK